MERCEHPTATANVRCIDFKPEHLSTVVKTTDVVCDVCRCWLYSIMQRLDGTCFTEKADP